jgi:hypothetical protein
MRTKCLRVLSLATGGLTAGSCCQRAVKTNLLHPVDIGRIMANAAMAAGSMAEEAQ